MTFISVHGFHLFVYIVYLSVGCDVENLPTRQITMLQNRFGLIKQPVLEKKESRGKWRRRSFFACCCF